MQIMTASRDLGLFAILFSASSGVASISIVSRMSGPAYFNGGLEGSFL
jgi:hypothetical protein